jgi:hypothetical protein
MLTLLERRRDTYYHKLNGWDRVLSDFIERYNLIVDRLVEAIKFHCNIIGDI